MSGYLEVDEPIEQAKLELKEEISVVDTEFEHLVSGIPINVDDPTGGRWLVYPFLFSLSDLASPRLDWEHQEMKWVDPIEIQSMNTVPDLFKAWLQVKHAIE